MKWPFRRSAIPAETNLADVSGVLAVKRRHEDRLLQDPHVIGVGVGNKDDRYHIRLYVNDTVRPRMRLPRHLDGVPVYVVHTSGVKAFG